jgi:membrane-bound serine protease (ClpP class)
VLAKRRRQDYIFTMRRFIRRIAVWLPLAAFLAVIPLASSQHRAYAQDQADQPANRPHKAVVITCEGMIDDGLYKSIMRRSDQALSMGATHIIFDIDTYGGLVKSADDISTYLILELGKQAHTVAYVSKKAISAGAMISVSCKDIVMRQNTTIGDAAPITMGDSLDGVEREKVESFIRAIFTRAAEANGYPEPLLLAMVSMQLEVYRVRNLKTGQYEFFDANSLPTDSSEYDLDSKELIVRDDQILTLTAARALEYGIARAVVDSRQEVLTFLEKRDGIAFDAEVPVLEPLWSEQMVRWINSPTVMAVLVMLAMLGIYIELNTPGVGLPGLVAVIAIVIMVASKYLIGMANWLEIAVFAVGVILLAIEIFLIPGFGLTGIAGIILMAAGVLGMLVRNRPDEVPWPRTAFDWQLLLDGLMALSLGFVGFLVAAFALAKYLPRMYFLRGLMLEPAPAGDAMPVSMTAPSAGSGLSVGQVGEVVSPLRPVGQARFGDATVDVVAEGQFLEKGCKVKIMEIHGNRVVVCPVE